MTDTFDFDTVVKREHTGNLKGILTPPALREKHIETFNAAEMDFRTAPSILRAIHDLADNGLFGFTLMDEEYTDAVCWWMEHVRGVHIEPDWIEPAMGTIFSLATSIRLCVAKGQNMIVQPPVYNRYQQAADRIGRGTVYNPLIRQEDGSYTMDLEDLEQKMADSANTLLVLCNPQNPTGSVWPESVLTRVAEMAVRYNVVVYSDEIFADYTFGGHTVPMYCTVNGGRNNGISATSLGKTFNFTGVNHANMLIRDPVLRERFDHQKYSDHYGSLEPMARASLIAAYNEEGLAWRNAVQKLITENERTVRDFLSTYLPGVAVSPLEGSYVIWIDWRGLGKPWEEVRHILYDEAMFVLEDGTDFCIETEGFTRMNIATTKGILQGALERLRQVVPDLRHQKETRSA